MVNSISAEVHEDVKPVLKYAKDVEDEMRSVDSHYLVVVPENNKFPNHRQARKFRKALSMLEDILNSEEFKRKVIAYKRSDGQRLYQKNYLWNNEDQRLSNEDIYEIIMEGNEKMIPNSIGEMNLNSWVKQCNWFMSKVSIWCRKVIGSTNPSKSKWIKLNWKFYRKYEVNEMVSNLVHEWLHLLGFLHGKSKIHEEVPYVVGAIAGEVAQGMLQREEILRH